MAANGPLSIPQMIREQTWSIGGMILTGANWRTRRKTCPRDTLSTENPESTALGAKTDLRGEKSVLWHSLFLWNFLFPIPISWKFDQLFSSSYMAERVFRSTTDRWQHDLGWKTLQTDGSKSYFGASPCWAKTVGWSLRSKTTGAAMQAKGLCGRASGWQARLAASPKVSPGGGGAAQEVT
jgi:hypothetical protein